jgi:two-component system sensor histidine kinase CpxA
MRSVYTKILFWCFGVLVFSLAAFILITIFVSGRPAGTRVFGGMSALQLVEATEAYQSGGAKQLAAYLQKLDTFLHGRHFFTDAVGKDLITGEDHSALLAKVHSSWGAPHHVGEELITARRSADGRYRLIIVSPEPLDLTGSFPYYLLVLAAIAILCWLLAVNIANPLRSLSGTVDRFGRGELSLRVNSRRRDEIGDLSRSFDQMAQRIQTLLTAERQLLQDISHELRSPLARLSFAAELTKTADDRSAAAARLRKDIDRLTSMVGSLLQVTRLEGDPSSRHPEDVLLSPLLQELVDDCRVEAEARGCRLVLEASPTLSVQGDRELLRRAIENILRNAIRYAPEATPIEIKLEAAGDAALITIRDYGPGVPEELLPKIFAPFFRVDVSRDNATGGAGLGLAIAQRAVSVHHGRVRAQNVTPGLLVSIELPLKAV